MRNAIKYNDVPVQQRQVDVVHILSDGKILISEKDFEPYQNRFVWMNRDILHSLIDELRPQTDSSRKSIITIYENGEIKTFPNVSNNFTNYGLLPKMQFAS